ncbi:myo-inositol-1-phosphate synthase [Agromyces sp. CF514]|uniref:inositol-3-phosphate synthase n=1 Tax=Agromyces sp. CF514 TaxID=1881031 RepID=UPI0008E3402D|nr:inositol-3-phosphate synthase [Agromyces sp. CF514]SFR91331.1 myo-inositol-1-phosphate synthase [Agromyces sp. CF514]
MEHTSTPHDTDTTSPWNRGRVGLWLIGARGSVATTVAVGVHALAAGIAPPTGCTTAGAGFAEVPLPGFDEIVIGGHDVSAVPLGQRAEQLAASGMIPAAIVAAVRAELDATDAEIRPAVSDADARQADVIARLAADIIAFRERHGLAHVTVVDVSSTEPLPADRPEFHDTELLAAALADPDRAVLPASSLAGLAAVEAGAAYACFTPSAGLALPALRAIAQSRIPFAGQDGKTGETLLRTVLAPMFVERGMHVLSWAGANLLGGGDGQTLADPEAVRSKLASKTRGLQSLVGDHVVAPLHIDNVPDLGDVKTAWDHVHAEGFLSSRITLQTTWTAYDSMLAAPLVIDLARLLSLAGAAGVRGVVPALGCFFKDPWGSDVHAFADQVAALRSWTSDLGEQVAAAAPVPAPAAREADADPVPIGATR